MQDIVTGLWTNNTLLFTSYDAVVSTSPSCYSPLSEVEASSIVSKLHVKNQVFSTIACRLQVRGMRLDDRSPRTGI